jgi:hypothetical protein
MTNVYPLQHRIYQANHRLLCFEFRRPVIFEVWMYPIRVITKLPNSEQSYKGKVKTHKYIDRQNQSTTGKL